jgi:hypothetical protein
VEAARIDGHGLDRGRLVKQAGLAFDADDGLGQGAGADPSGGVEFAELGDRLLPDLGADADGADQSPPGVRLAVLGDGGVTEIHKRPSWTVSLRHGKRESWHYIRSGEEGAKCSKDLCRRTS